MRAAIIDGETKVVCENCKKPFIINDTFTIVSGIHVAEEIMYYGNTLYPSNRAMTMNDLHHQSWYHTSCLPDFNNPQMSLDSLKENINKLSQEERRSIYLFLYNAHGCRI